MSTARPDHSRPDPLVRVQVTETVEQLNSRGPMTAAAFEIFAADNDRCELLQGRVKMMSPAGVRCVINVHPVDRTATIHRGSS